LVDDLAVEDVRPFELALVQHLRANRGDILEHIRTTREMPPAGQLEEAIREVKKGFNTISKATKDGATEDGGTEDGGTEDGRTEDEASEGQHDAGAATPSGAAPETPAPGPGAGTGGGA
jgi:hypothetical protein